MPKKELEKDDLEAVLEDGNAVIENEEAEDEFLAAFDEEDDGYKSPDPDPVPEAGSDEAGEGDNAPVADTSTGDTEEGGEAADDKEDADVETVEEESPAWLKHIQEMENRIATRMRNVEGHIGGLKSQMMQAKQDTAADGDTAPTAAQIKEAAGSKGSTEKMDALKEEFPEWADALEELEGNYAANAAVQPQAETFTRDEVAYLVNNATSRARELARVDAAHPGWEDTRNTPEFVQWRDSQPETTQVLADSSKAADAIKMFDLYVEATQPQAPANKGKTKERLKRSVAPRTTGAAPVQHVQTEEEDFLAEFNS